ncbi:Equilibrative nucleoside transporter,Major facilitator superfamily domain [Cinara cedri]|uniref:Equilibrative nucleoside transporter,Major facilitator superfamily domain n=1 Tax=Cinara cedri TaxID=506608 RepID=A0A5E4MQT7_9HEMI|nr:Equilibrative nucleoside transporter,Major facilitator superfamily domain [Cinara cedri]
MDENLSRGYVALGIRGDVCPLATPPTDRLGLVYAVMLLAGAGFLFPYNSFVMAVDYFQIKYPDSMVVFDMTIVYILVAFVAVLTNNLLVDTLSFTCRINIGYGLTISTLLFVGLVEVFWEGIFVIKTTYCLNLIAISIIAWGATILQSSFYGYTSILPTKYTQAVMIGESAAGLWVSVNRIFTKLMSSDLRVSTFFFFLISHLVVAVSCVLFQMVQSSDFVKFYIARSEESKKKISLEPTEECVNSEQCQPEPVAETSLSAGKLFKDENLLSFANPMYDPNTSNVPTYKVEDVMVHIETSNSFRLPKSNWSEFWTSFKNGYNMRKEVSKVIWKQMLAIFLCYFVTLSIYPGVLSDLVSPRFGTWMPVLVMTVFNVFDLLGKLLGAYTYEQWDDKVLNSAERRLFMIPAILLIVIVQHPFHTRLISEFLIVLQTTVLGITNGITGSVPMIFAPAKVVEERRELAGNIMTISYIAGTTAGSLFAYVLDKIIHFEYDWTDDEHVFGGHNDFSADPEPTTVMTSLNNKSIIYFTAP